MASDRMVHVIDDDPAVGDAVAFLLRYSGDFEVRTYVSGASFLSQVHVAKPGCILLDIQMPGMNGLDVQRRLNEQNVRFPVIMLTGRGDVRIAVKAMKAGAVEFLEKPYEDEALLGALQEAFEQLETSREEAAFAQRARERTSRLTPREHEILQGLLAGHHNKIIAYELGLSTRTVEIYRASVMDKLDARSLSMAIRLALAAGLEPMATGLDAERHGFPQGRRLQ